MDTNSYLEIFIEETREHLQNLNDSLMVMEKDISKTSELDEIFRAAHTLKGMAGTMGFEKTAKLTHIMEDVLHHVRNGKIKLSDKIIQILFECLDVLQEYLENIIEEKKEGEIESKHIIDKLKEIMASIDEDSQSLENKTEYEVLVKTDDATGSSLNEDDDFTFFNQYDINIMKIAIEENKRFYRIDIELNEDCRLKSSRAYIIFKVVESFGEIVKANPSVEEIEDEKFDKKFSMYVVLDDEPTELINGILNTSEIKDVFAKDLLTSENIETMNRSINISKNENQKDETTKNLNSNNNVDELKIKKKNVLKTVRVDIDRLDMLMNLVSELIIVKTRLNEFKFKRDEQQYIESIEYLERVTTNLNDAVMKVRMVPVGTVFNRFTRMIRDTAKSLNKKVELILSGEETELDRTVIDEIGDPLIHLLRNSADHGLESEEFRKKIGKDEKGTINLRAYQDGNNVVIEVEDDGKGLDKVKIKSKIIDGGILDKEKADLLRDDEIYEYLFEPSFSTASEITEFSGRGVGLDVVKTKIESLGGHVGVTTKEGLGTKFKITLPLTLAIMQVLMVNIGAEKYAIPLSSIREIIKLKKEEISFVQNQEAFILRDKVIHIIRLNEKLEIEETEHSKNSDKHTILIVSKGERLYGFVVDSLIGQQEIIIKSLGKLLTGLKIIAGASVLGDGNVALILDVNAMK